MVMMNVDRDAFRYWTDEYLLIYGVFVVPELGVMQSTHAFNQQRPTCLPQRASAPHIGCSFAELEEWGCQCVAKGANSPRKHARPKTSKWLLTTSLLSVGVLILASNVPELQSDTVLTNILREAAQRMMARCSRVLQMVDSSTRSTPLILKSFVS